MSTLVVLEHDNGAVRQGSLSAISFANSITEQSNGDVSVLVIGHEVACIAQDASRFAHVLCSDDSRLAHPLADRFAKVIADIATQIGAKTVVAASTSWSKDIVGRAAGLLGGAMASDVIGHQWIDGELHLQRPMFAGSMTATVVLSGSPKIITVGPAAYQCPCELDSAGTIESVDVDATQFSDASQFEELNSKKGARPDVTEARIVASGGRAFKSSEDFERLVGGFADCMQAATGSSRALVDAGITPNSFQVGQTGKIIAPDCYFALGISGAVQHLAGMKNSKLVVAINKDADAPIFEVSDYGLVSDVYDALPQLIEKLSAD